MFSLPARLFLFFRFFLLVVLVWLYAPLQMTEEDSFRNDL